MILPGAALTGGPGLPQDPAWVRSGAYRITVTPDVEFAAQVQVTVTPLERNRVALRFDIEEGAVTKIADINIIGAKDFSERTLKREMKLTTPGWFTWFTKDDQYSKQQLTADLEALRAAFQAAAESVVPSATVTLRAFERSDLSLVVALPPGNTPHSGVDEPLLLALKRVNWMLVVTAVSNALITLGVLLLLLAVWR